MLIVVEKKLKDVLMYIWICWVFYDIYRIVDATNKEFKYLLSSQLSESDEGGDAISAISKDNINIPCFKLSQLIHERNQSVGVWRLRCPHQLLQLSNSRGEVSGAEDSRHIDQLRLVGRVISSVHDGAMCDAVTMVSGCMRVLTWHSFNIRFRIDQFQHQIYSF